MDTKKSALPKYYTASEYPRRPYTFDRVVRIVFSVIGIIGVLYLLNILKGVLLPFIVACLLAYLLEPLVKLNMRILHLRKRFFPVMATLLEVILLITLFCWIFIPYLIEEGNQMVELVKKYATTQIEIPYISEQIHRYIKMHLNIDELSKWMSRDEWWKVIKQAITQSWSLVSQSLAFLLSALSWLIVLLYLIFIMIDYERMMLSFKQLVPLQHRTKVFAIAADVKNAMNRYFRGQFAIAMIVGVLFSIGFLIIKLPMAVVLGLFIGILNLVPYLQLISLPITALLCLVGYVGGVADFWVLFIEAMAVYVVVQGIQDLILTPKIMGKAMGLNPAIILLSLSIWGCLLGFLGLIIALPLTTLILSYYDTYVVNRVQHIHGDEAVIVLDESPDTPTTEAQNTVADHHNEGITDKEANTPNDKEDHHD